jgi:hypothetical protein
MNDRPRLRCINYSSAIWLVGGLFVFGVIGCKSSHELETAPVSGKVMLDGKPVTSGTVTFVPSRGRAAKGEVNSAGKFTLSTYRDADGAIVGHHQAAVMVLRADIPKTGPEQNQPIMAIPSRYGVAEESGLKYEVKPGQANEFTLELSTK